MAVVKPLRKKLVPLIEVIHGDCRDLVPKIGNDFQFTFADPPFNIGQEYNGYNDSKPDNEYTRFTLDWIHACWMKTEILALHGPDNLVGLYLHASHLWNMHRVAWVNWHYRFGQCGRNNWIDSRTHCLIFVKNRRNYTWNPDAVLVPSDRATKYGDKRIHDTERGGMRLPFSIWGIPSDGPNWGRVQGNSVERQSHHPNQLPEVYLERLLRAYTNRGDWVLDPFAGSGTTAVVAQALERHCVTTDISKSNCLSVETRLRKGAVRI